MNLNCLVMVSTKRRDPANFINSSFYSAQHPPQNPNKFDAEDSLDQAIDNIEDSNEANLYMLIELEEQNVAWEKHLAELQIMIRQVMEKLDRSLVKQEALVAKMQKLKNQKDQEGQ